MYFNINTINPYEQPIMDLFQNLKEKVKNQLPPEVEVRCAYHYSTGIRSRIRGSILPKIKFPNRSSVVVRFEPFTKIKHVLGDEDNRVFGLAKQYIGTTKQRVYLLGAILDPDNQSLYVLEKRTQYNRHAEYIICIYKQILSESNEKYMFDTNLDGYISYFQLIDSLHYEKNGYETFGNDVLKTFATIYRKHPILLT